MFRILEEILQYSFKNISLLENALTHTSKGGQHFQRLEFLGDRVLNLSLTLLLLEQSPHATEGELAQTIAKLGSKDILLEQAQQWRLYDFVNCIPIQKTAILSDTCEAVIAAIFLDANENIHTLKEIIKYHWKDYLSNRDVRDPKTLLQEIAYKNYQCTPEYTTEFFSGKDHNPTFISNIILKQYKSSGIGKSRKESEKAAAKEMLIQIQKIIK